MKKLTCAVLILLFFVTTGVFSEAAIDFGGTISNLTGLEISGESLFSQNNGLSLWFSAKGENTGFIARAGYTFVYDQEADDPVKNIPDIQTLNLYGNFPVTVLGLSRYRYDLGRFRISDHSRYIIDQNLDGVRFRFFYPTMSIQAAVGTSLLPNKNSAPIVISKLDVADIDDDGVFMGSPRAIGLLEMTFSDLFRQELTLSVGFQEDLRHLLESRSGTLIEEGEQTLDPSSGGLLDTQYLGLGVRGNITGGLFYNTFFSLSTGRTLSYLIDPGAVSGSYAYTPILSGVGGIGLNLYLPQVMSSAAGLSFVLSTGDDWEDRATFYEGSETENPALFVPVTAKPLSFVFAPTLGNMMVFSGSYSLKPLSIIEGFALREKLQTSVKFGVFSSYKSGPVSVSVPNTDSEKKYLGSEVDLAVSFRPFSDLGLSLTGGMFFPNESDGGPYDAPGSTGATTKVEISASFSF